VARPKKTGGSTDTRERLLDEAERLFASGGIEATSVRDIVGAARANLGAITYHFGTKQALVRAVIDRRALPLNRERLRQLDAADARSGSPAALEAILRAFVSPTIQLARESPAFMQVMARLHAEPGARRMPSYAKELFRRFMKAFRRELPHLPPREIVLRGLFVAGAVAHSWTTSHKLGALPEGLRAAYEHDDLVEALVRFSAAGMRAPLLAPRAARRSRVRESQRS
jgi:AcrR family transcriptional regulator